MADSEGDVERGTEDNVVWSSANMGPRNGICREIKVPLEPKDQKENTPQVPNRCGNSRKMHWSITTQGQGPKERFETTLGCVKKAWKIILRPIDTGRDLGDLSRREGAIEELIQNRTRGNTKELPGDWGALCAGAQQNHFSRSNIADIGRFKAVT
ncbi:hypothetical protein CPB84DRAFT_1830802 [Gymnopilus junonius]|uniref:Uncharacterized protein n=1 Tax=Gymnopilus junonius TaxID=109634 RepID=A0A9P5N7G6_GYMJU|nr:hypothetical protein CPB84DRAFT_1830802 [Gymnopilus junonius]